MRTLTLALATLLTLAAPARAAALDDLVLDYEAGPLFFAQNDGRYGANGTAFGAGVFGQNQNLFRAQRVSAEARFAERQALVLLWAPLDVTTRATQGSPLTFRDTTFAAGSVVDARYLFDGFRASWLYRWWESPSWTIETGLSGQVRNAEVSLTEATGARFASERDIGFVPALKWRVKYTTPSGVYAAWEADGLNSFGLSRAGGWILDSALTLGLPVREELDGVLRLRYVGGGADVPFRSFYNWGQFVLLTAGVRWSLMEPARP